jgi:hypothetical protein
MSPALMALADLGPRHEVQVADQVFPVLSLDFVHEADPVVLAQTLGNLPLTHESTFRTLWVSKRGRSGDLQRTFRRSDWLNIHTPRNSQVEATMLGLRQRVQAAHHRRVMHAIRIKMDRLSYRFAEGTFRRKQIHPEISEAIGIILEERNQRYLRDPACFEWLITNLHNGGPLADLMYREDDIDMETCMRVATAWRARVVEDHVRNAHSDHSRRRRGPRQPVSSISERLHVTRSYRLDTLSHTGFRMMRSELHRPN